MRTEPLIEGSERVGYKVINITTGEEAVMAHKSIDSRLRVLGYGIDTESLESVAIPAIEHRDYSEVIVIDEIGKFAVESEGFVNVVRSALEVDKPTLLALHKKSRHPCYRIFEEETMLVFSRLLWLTEHCYHTKFTS